MKALELAKLEDAALCNEIINAGKEFQKKQGFIQWTDAYPNINTIQDDISNNKGYVLKIDGEIAGYMCIDFHGEPAYDDIEGAWHTDEPYAVVHRMSFHSAYLGMGLADTAFQLIDALCIANQINSIRVDTDYFNKRMQHILEKNGYMKCGMIVFQGSDKIAYDKTVS